MCGRSRWRGGRGGGWGPSPNVAIPDPGFPGGMMLALGICADDLAGVDLGELQRRAGQLPALRQRRALHRSSLFVKSLNPARTTSASDIGASNCC